VREKAGTSDAYAVAETLHSRTSPLPRPPVFAARQRYVEDVVAPPTKAKFFQQVTFLQAGFFGSRFIR
ncbi:hypothetical protein, partial [Pseudomonas viridiflava]|uniref:hypothetical protein n=1 Tax=Pseudomonas viridiflava TaxID=33069 RepID=UPI002EC96296|nr:hypothetical protein [Pseudomonas viridiflava]